MEQMRIKSWRAILIGILVLGVLFAGEANAAFKSCYESCFLICVITTPNHSPLTCSYKCLKDCILPVPPTSTDSKQTTVLPHDHHGDLANNDFYYCKLGCAASLCANFSTEQNPRSKKVERCVDSCSDTCIKNKKN